MMMMMSVPSLFWNLIKIKWFVLVLFKNGMFVKRDSDTAEVLHDCP